MTHTPVSIVREQNARRTETPNAVMTTLASPTLGGTTDLCLWRVAFAAGASGPDHTMDTEQVWHLEQGEARCQVGEVEVSLQAGDSIRFPGGIPRRIHATTAAGFIVCGQPGAVASTPSSDEGVVPAWIR